MGQSLCWVLGGVHGKQTKKGGNRRVGMRDKGRGEKEVRVQQLGLLSRGFSCFGV